VPAVCDEVVVSAREELAAIVRRHDEDHEHPEGEQCDLRVAVGALLAVLDLEPRTDPEGCACRTCSNAGITEGVRQAQAAVEVAVKVRTSA
jgi:hypothetical protein